MEVFQKLSPFWNQLQILSGQLIDIISKAQLKRWGVFYVCIQTDGYHSENCQFVFSAHQNVKTFFLILTILTLTDYKSRCIKCCRSATNLHKYCLKFNLPTRVWRLIYWSPNKPTAVTFALSIKISNQFPRRRFDACQFHVHTSILYSGNERRR